MATQAPTYKDIYIDPGADFRQEVDISVPFADYVFFSNIKRNYDSDTVLGTLTFEAVANEPTKMRLVMTDGATEGLPFGRSVYDVYGKENSTDFIHKEIWGVADVSRQVTTITP